MGKGASCHFEIGDKIRFKPAGFFESTTAFGQAMPAPVEVTGQVIYINEAHRYFRVEYTLSGCIGHECFKF